MKFNHNTKSEKIKYISIKKKSVLPSFVSKHAIHLVKKFPAILLKHRNFLKNCKVEDSLPILHGTYCLKLWIFNSFKCSGHKLHRKPLGGQNSPLLLWHHSAQSFCDGHLRVIVCSTTEFTARADLNNYWGGKYNQETGVSSAEHNLDPIGSKYVTHKG